MFDERTKQAIIFLENICDYPAYLSQMDCASNFLNYLKEKKKYTPNSKVRITKQLVYDIMDADRGIPGKKDESGELKKCESLFALHGEGKPNKEIVENTWKTIYRKYPAKGIRSTILDVKFVFEILDIAEDIWIGCFDKPSREKPEPQKQSKPPEDPAKALKQKKQDKIYSQLNLEKEAEHLFMLNRNKEATKKFEEALSLADSPDSKFSIYSSMAAKMTGGKKYAEALRFLYRGTAYLQSFPVYGKPVLDNLFMDYSIVKNPGERITARSLFHNIQSALFLLKYIPKEETTRQERCHRAGYTTPTLGTHSAPVAGTHSAPPSGRHSAPVVGTHAAPPAGT